MIQVNRKIKIIGITFLSILVISLLIFGSIKLFFNNIDTTYFSASYALDINNPEEVVGNSDYVFAGKVIEELDTTYDSVSNIPTTAYGVEVISDIKGDLSSYGNETTVYKFGGLSEDKDSYILAEDDELLTEGKVYIFCARVGSDGDLHVSNPNATVPVENLDSKSSEGENSQKLINEIKSTDTYADYEKSYKNEININRERFKYKER